MSGEPEILFDLRDGVAEVTLNRPQALNALTLDMVRVFDPQLAAWEMDDAVRAVVVRGAGRALHWDATGARCASVRGRRFAMKRWRKESWA